MNNPKGRDWTRVCQNLMDKAFTKQPPFPIHHYSFDGFWKNGSHLSEFLMVGLPDFRYNLKSRPFSTQPFFDHSKSRFQIPLKSKLTSVHLILKGGIKHLLSYFYRMLPNCGLPAPRMCESHELPLAKFCRCERTVLIVNSNDFDGTRRHSGSLQDLLR